MNQINQEIFNFEDIDLLFEAMERIENRLSHFEYRHEQFSHSFDIVFGKTDFILKVSVYEKRKYKENN